MFSTETIRRNWLSNIRADIRAGIVVALALIPEAIGFSIIAGDDPRVGLYASVVIAIVISFAGGRPAMISAATAATAVLFGALVREHGLQYLLAATILAGVIQIIAGWLRVGTIMRFVSRSVMTGFVNALAILIFMAQLPELIGVTSETYVLIAAGLAIIYLFPLLTTKVPSPLVCILVLTGLAIALDIDTRTVADLGELPDVLPVLLFPDIPLNLETLWIILPAFMSDYNKRFAIVPARADDLHRPLNLTPDRLTEILCKREQRYVGSQLTFSFERKRIMLEESEVTRGLAGRYVETYAYSDGRLDVRWKGYSLPYTVFDKEQRVMHAAITENKRLGEALSWIKAQQDEAQSAPKIKTNSEQIGYQKRGTKPGRRTDFMNDPAVIARRQEALAKQATAE